MPSASEQASQEPQTIKITTAQGYKRSKLLEIQAEEAQEFLLLSSFLSQKPEPSPMCVRGHFCLFRDAFSASLLLETNVRRLRSESSHTPRLQLFFFFLSLPARDLRQPHIPCTKRDIRADCVHADLSGITCYLAARAGGSRFTCCRCCGPTSERTTIATSQRLMPRVSTPSHHRQTCLSGP